jgi:hypothetical protein
MKNPKNIRWNKTAHGCHVEQAGRSIANEGASKHPEAALLTKAVSGSSTNNYVKFTPKIAAVSSVEK